MTGPELRTIRESLKPHPLHYLETFGVFSAASRLKIPRKWKKVITSQPGYCRGDMMGIFRCPWTGGFRLYVWIDSHWMDGSLKDIDE